MKYFLWVKAIDCEQVRQEFDLFPGYLIADDTRHPLNVLVCRDCGELNEVADLKQPGQMPELRSKLIVKGPPSANPLRLPALRPRQPLIPPEGMAAAASPVRDRVLQSASQGAAQRAAFSRSRRQGLGPRGAAAAARWKKTTPRFVPEQKILAGDETDRLHRWGYRHYRELFNDRQLLGLERSCQPSSPASKTSVCGTRLRPIFRTCCAIRTCCAATTPWRSSRSTSFLFTAFPVGLVQCESNLLGIINGNGPMSAPAAGPTSSRNTPRPNATATRRSRS